MYAHCGLGVDPLHAVCAAGMGAAPTPYADQNSPAPRWLQVPRVQGHMTAADLGVVINTADPYSVAVGKYYVQRRGIPPEQVLRVDLPVRPALSVAEFGVLYAQIRDHMGPQV